MPLLSIHAHWGQRFARFAGLALAALAASAWTGVRLTYRYGVRVADEATQREGFVIRATASPAPEDIDKTAEVVT